MEAALPMVLNDYLVLHRREIDIAAEYSRLPTLVTGFACAGARVGHKCFARAIRGTELS